MGCERVKNLLLDTHVFIWLMNGDKSIPLKIRQLINKSVTESNVYLSIISCWEIAMLECKKRIALTLPCQDWIEASTKRSGIQVLPLTPNICVESCNLPDGFHEDSADRVIVASARIEDLTLITRDDQILKYAKKHHVKAIKT